MGGKPFFFITIRAIPTASKLRDHVVSRLSPSVAHARLPQHGATPRSCSDVYLSSRRHPYLVSEGRELLHHGQARGAAADDGNLRLFLRSIAARGSAASHAKRNGGVCTGCFCPLRGCRWAERYRGVFACWVVVCGVG